MLHTRGLGRWFGPTVLDDDLGHKLGVVILRSGGASLVASRVLSGLCPGFGVEDVAQPVTDEVEGEDGQQ